MPIIDRRRRPNKRSNALSPQFGQFAAAALRSLRKAADLWVYGHTHESDDTVIGATRVVSNAKGYGPWMPQQRTWDNRSFDPNLIIEI